MYIMGSQVHEPFCGTYSINLSVVHRIHDLTLTFSWFMFVVLFCMLYNNKKLR